jgi:hypothetical protein
VTLRDVTVSDTAVHCTVENIGQQRYDTLHIRLLQDGSRDGASLEAQTVVLDTLLPGQRTAVTLPVTVTAVGQLPLWRATLTVGDDSTACSLELAHSLATSYPTLSLRLLNIDSNEVTSVLPGRSYLLQAFAEGPYDSISVTLNDEQSFTFHLSPFILPLPPSPDTLCTMHLEGTIYLGMWSQRQDYWLEAGDRIDSFAHGLDSHPWQNSDRSPWILDSSVAHSGVVSLRSGALGDGQYTKLCLDVLLSHDDSVSFWLKTSTEAQYDKFSFQLDGRTLGFYAWGETDWRQYSYALPAGHHTLCWNYTKDLSGHAGNDCVWIDDVRLPLAYWDSLYDWSCTTATPVDVGVTPEGVTQTPLTLYPNPACGEVWMEAAESLTVQVCDALGRPVATFSLRGGEPYRWDTRALPQGLYFATASNSRQTVCRKIIIRKD